MDTTTVPKTRELRGLAIYHDHAGEIEPQGRGVYTVPGCSGGAYTVDLAVFGGEESCTCPDFERRRDTCKHIIAATIHRAKSNAQRRRASRPGFSPGAIAANLARMGA